jgi:PAS domain S-box-containing protein
MSLEEIRDLVCELQIHEIELQLQNEELRQSQLELAEARDRYSDLYEHAPIGYLTLDDQGTILNANRAASVLLGLERRQLLGSKFVGFVPESEAERFHVHQRDVFARGARQTCELNLKRADGAVLHVRLESTAFPGQGGSRWTRTTVVDLTDQKRAAKAIRLLNDSLERRVAEQTAEIRLLATALSHLGEGVMITTDREEWSALKIVFVNQAMCRITGYERGELIGQSPAMLQGPATDPNLIARLQTELAHGHSCTVELSAYRKDGTRYEAEMFVAPIVDSMGRRRNFAAIYHDISERKAAAERLQQSETRFRALLQATSDVIYRMSPDWSEMLYLQGRDFIADTRHADSQWLDHYVHPEDHDLVRENMAEAVQQQSVYELEHRVLRVDGTVGWVYSRAVPIINTEGEVEEWFGAASDITDRKQAVDDLQDREERLNAILQTASDAIITINSKGIIASINPAGCQMFGYREEELLNQNVKMLMPPPFCEEHDDYLARYDETGIRRIIGVEREVLGLRKDGSSFPVELSVSEVDHMHVFAGIVRDVSERKKLQREVLDVAESEQRRIGRELHDGAQQELVGVGLFAQTLLSQLKSGAEGLPEESRENLCALASKIADGIGRAQREVQSIARGLAPLQLDQRGLDIALRDLAGRTDGVDGVACVFQSERAISLADGEAATHLYRIAQEAVTNALKHARAKQITIRLLTRDDRPVLEIVDDGVGGVGVGVGVKTMVYRAGLIGAQLDIQPVASGGTRVACCLLGHRGVESDDAVDAERLAR